MLVEDEKTVLELVHDYIAKRAAVEDPSVEPPADPKNAEEKLGPEIWKELKPEERKVREEEFEEEKKTADKAANDDRIAAAKEF